MKYLFDVVDINNKILVRCLKKTWLGGYETYYSRYGNDYTVGFETEFTNRVSSAYEFIKLDDAIRRVHSCINNIYSKQTTKILYSPYEPKQEEFV